MRPNRVEKMFNYVQINGVLFVIRQKTILAIRVLLFPQNVNLVHFKFPEIHVACQLEPFGDDEVKRVWIPKLELFSRR